MKLARLLILLTSACVFSLVAIGGGGPVIAPVPAPNLSPPCTGSMTTIHSCPNTGCSDSGDLHSLGDALLNQAKNRVGAVANPTPTTLNEIRALAQPATWDTGTPRTSIANIEDRKVVVMGFLLKAIRQGKESCNCGITGPTNTDIHLVLVSALPDDTDDQDQIDEAEAGSVTAEITPRIRQNSHPTWVVRNINDFEGEFVRVTGRMMLDTKHIPQAHRLEGELPNKPLKRATSWEVHPVTKFQVCQTTQAKCDHTTGPPNWKAF